MNDRTFLLFISSETLCQNGPLGVCGSCVPCLECNRHLTRESCQVVTSLWWWQLISHVCERQDVSWHWMSGALQKLHVQNLVPLQHISELQVSRRHSRRVIRLESKARYRMSWLRPIVQVHAEMIIRTGRAALLPSLFQSIIHQYSYHRRCVVGTNSVVK